MSLDERLAALAGAVELAEGRLDPELVGRARGVVTRAGERIGLGVESTVVALAGPTGAGKSSLFNALAGEELARASRRRPTTAHAAAAVWGDAGGPLLDWLEVPRRHRRDGDPQLDGLVLLDLPDFDSVELAHHVEVDRLVELVDLLVWVVDPQKYADAALHDRYLRPLAGHGGSMLAVLNQADLLAPEALAAARTDLERVLRADGLGGVPVLAVSAETGEGVAALRAALADRVAARAAAVERLGADVTAAAHGLAQQCEGSPGGVSKQARERLHGALAEAAGVPTVARAVAAAHRRRGALAAGWPFARWIKRLRPDPLRRLRLGDRPVPDVHTSLPGPSGVQRAQVEAAARAVAAGVSGDLGGRWPALVRAAATVSEERLPAELDRAVAGADLRLRAPHWWRLVGLLQRLLAAAALAGGLWLLVLVGLSFLRLEDVVPLPEAWGIPVPTLLLLAGLAAGLLLGVLARVVNGAGAARRARRAERALRARVDEVGDELILAPVEAEIAAYERLCGLLAEAADAPRRRGLRAAAS